MANDEKTNVMRLLTAAKILFLEHSYDPGITDGERVAEAVGTDPDKTFKTLVTQGDPGKYYVFVIPVNRELDLKRAARAVGVKSVSMLPQKMLLPLTGYIHGGCSPIGMKKKFPTVFDETAMLSETLTLSAGKVGRQITVSPNQLLEYLGATTAVLSREKHQS